VVISPVAIDYGQADPGAVVTRSFTVHNTGGTVATIMKSKPPIGGVFVATSSLDETSKLAPGAQRTLTVEFRPQAAGDAADAWDITADDDTGPQRINFTGRGAAAPQPDPPAQVQQPQAQVPVLLPEIPRNPFTAPIARPSLTLLRLGAARRHVSFRLTRAARVTMAIERRRACRSTIGRCFDYTQAGKSWSVAGRAGSNGFALPRRELRAGRYRLTATPRGGTARHATFRVR
jgi:hypothetical protein